MDALILAGGKSSRMGGIHKGSLQFQNESFTQRLISQLKPHVETLWLSYGDTVQQEDLDCMIVRDEYLNCGPMGGLHAGLKNTGSDMLIVAACDMPLLNWELYHFLLEKLENYDAVVPVVEGQIHPLAAVYTKKMLPLFESCLKAGNYRLRSALDQAKTRFVEAGCFAEMLQNINTMEEYLSFIKK